MVKVSNPAPIQDLRVYSKSKPIRFKQKITNAPTIRIIRKARNRIPITPPTTEALFLLPKADFILFRFSFNIFIYIFIRRNRLWHRLRLKKLLRLLLLLNLLRFVFDLLSLVGCCYLFEYTVTVGLIFSFPKLFWISFIPH